MGKILSYGNAEEKLSTFISYNIRGINAVEMEETNEYSKGLSR